MSEKKQQKNKSPAISLNHQPILYYLYSHPANRWQQKSTHTFLFSFFSCWTVSFLWISKLGFQKTHTNKKNRFIGFFQEVLKPNGVARIAPHWSSAVGLRHLVPSSSSPRPPLVSGPSFVAVWREGKGSTGTKGVSGVVNGGNFQGSKQELPPYTKQNRDEGFIIAFTSKNYLKYVSTNLKWCFLDLFPVPTGLFLVPG